MASTNLQMMKSPDLRGFGPPSTNVNCPGAPAANRPLFDNKTTGKFLKLLNIPNTTITYFSDATEGVKITIARSGTAPSYWNDVIDRVNARYSGCQAAVGNTGACATNHCISFWYKRRDTSVDTEAGGCGTGVATCDYAALVVGEKCASEDIVYAGTSGGNRIYARSADQGTATWNNGTGNFPGTGVFSNSDGLTNTNTLIGLVSAGAPYAAAVMCRSLGAQWYVPAPDELNLLYSVRHTGAFNGTFNETGVYYWTSRDASMNSANVRRFNDGVPTARTQNTINLVRCTQRNM